MQRPPDDPTRPSRDYYPVENPYRCQRCPADDNLVEPNGSKWAAHEAWHAAMGEPDLIALDELSLSINGRRGTTFALNPSPRLDGGHYDRPVDGLYRIVSRFEVEDRDYGTGRPSRYTRRVLDWLASPDGETLPPVPDGATPVAVVRLDGPTLTFTLTSEVAALPR